MEKIFTQDVIGELEKIFAGEEYVAEMSI